MSAAASDRPFERPGLWMICLLLCRSCKPLPAPRQSISTSFSARCHRPWDVPWHCTVPALPDLRRTCPLDVLSEARRLLFPKRSPDRRSIVEASGDATLPAPGRTVESSPSIEGAVSNPGAREDMLCGSHPCPTNHARADTASSCWVPLALVRQEWVFRRRQCAREVWVGGDARTSGPTATRAAALAKCARPGEPLHRSRLAWDRVFKLPCAFAPATTSSSQSHGTCQPVIYLTPSPRQCPQGLSDPIGEAYCGWCLALPEEWPTINRPRRAASGAIPLQPRRAWRRLDGRVS
jgi:hypothetical protein